MPEGDGISERECDSKHETLNEWVKSINATMTARMDKLEGKLWLIITLLFGNLSALITLIVKK